MTGMAVLQYGNLCIDPNQRRVYVNEQVVELTTMEFNILYYHDFLFTRSLRKESLQNAYCNFIAPLQRQPYHSSRYRRCNPETE